MTKITSVKQYLNQFEGEVVLRINRIRQLVKNIAPDATEGFSYGLIGYKRNGKPLVYIGGFKTHIGLYATSQGHQALAKEFSKYKHGKGSVQLPLTKPLPENLVRQVIELRKKQTD
ncbi:DUF1801 domain-containing protein [Candidatus Berkelbacteria bacterium]|nr:DUF1801 domain-containing protein [Candidatus Berkelbacteria bacterium]